MLDKHLVLLLSENQLMYGLSREMKFKKKNVSIIKVSYCHQVAYFGKELIA
jgi:hypothetical protein